MTTIAHISDLHFGREQATQIAGLRKALAQAAPYLLIISGDITQRARHREFQLAERFLSTLPFPYLIVPGNHDLSAHRLIERFVFPWRKWRRYISHDLEPQTSLPGVHVVGVNSARRFGWYWDWSRGRISSQQVSEVVAALQTAEPDTLKVVVAHHPFWLPTANLRRQLIGGYRHALEQFQAAGADLILGGHIHLPFINIVNGMLISHAGTTISDRLVKGQPNSFNLIQGDSHQLTLQTLEWEEDHFALRQQQSFRKQSDGWQQH